ncbi:MULTISPECIES: hypothetical protein [unclassified Microbacterium]|uniref:hypothetical protein n=1 Tax=unclassified Microbacterium TaxID=2609290 RepID=UPI003658008C
MSDQAQAGRGLRTVLLATVLAGGVGYLIQALVPPLLTQINYLAFTTFWSATYLVVSCLAGVQQELTRASRSGASGTGYRTWRLFAVSASVTAALVVAAIFSMIGGHIFPVDTIALVAAITIAAFGYCLIAAVSGALYGVQDWPGVGGMTVADSLIRAATLGIALLMGGTAAMLGWAVAVPFLLAVIVVWLWRGRRISGRLQLDVGLSQLLRNTSATLIASLATGALISGLPLLLRALASDAGVGFLASLILVISLTRAPLVVPLVALQGFLLVHFRENRHHAASVLRWVGGLLLIVSGLSALAAWLGPVILHALYPGFDPLSGVVFAAIVASAGLTGVLCITGPALLAASRHRWYVAGWLVSALMTVVVLAAPGDAQLRILVALVAAPVVGAVVHGVALVRTGQSAPTSA